MRNNCIKGKVFNLYLAENLVIVFFEGAKNLSYALVEISITNILFGFMNLADRFKQKLLKDAPKSLKSKLKQKMTISQNIQYFDINEFLREMTDFELIASLHNGKERIFYFINTMAIPEFQMSQKMNT